MIDLITHHAIDHRPTDFHRDLVKFFLYRVGTVMSRTALDGIHPGVGNQLQQIARLEADILYSQMAGHMVGNPA